MADRSLVHENWLFIRRWAAAAKMKIIIEAVAAELNQELSLPYYAWQNEMRKNGKVFTISKATYSHF